MYVTIHWQYKTPKGQELTFVSEEMSGSEALLAAADIQKTGRVKTLQFLDRYDSYWTIKELQKYYDEIETEPHHIRIYFDGGFQLHDGKAGVGIVIYYEQNGKSWRLRKNATLAQLTSNNEAEYAALYMALQQLAELGASGVAVDIYSDSKVVIHELNGEWAAASTFEQWAQKIEAELQALHLQPTYHYISRNDNKEADQLATQALHDIAIAATIQCAP